jgi:hypothetical protein
MFQSVGLTANGLCLGQRNQVDPTCPTRGSTAAETTRVYFFRRLSSNAAARDADPVWFGGTAKSTLIARLFELVLSLPPHLRFG